MMLGSRKTEIINGILIKVNKFLVNRKQKLQMKYKNA